MSVSDVSSATTWRFDAGSVVRELVTGVVPPREVAARAAAHGIPLDRPVRAFRVRPIGGSDSGVEQLLRRHAAHHWIGVATMDHDVIGLTTGMPCIGVSRAVVGLGPLGPLSRAHVSFANASRALDAAWAIGRRGSHRLDDVALAAAVVADDDVGLALHDRYLAPLERATGGTALEETILSLLTHDLDTATAAAALGIHRNSLRYRVRRFEELTGCDLSRLEDLFGVWWAIVRRQRLSRGESEMIREH